MRAAAVRVLKYCASTAVHPPSIPNKAEACQERVNDVKMQRVNLGICPLMS